jgi:DNA-binding CsgD family transcriptional regulator
VRQLSGVQFVAIFKFLAAHFADEARVGKDKPAWPPRRWGLRATPGRRVNAVTSPATIPVYQGAVEHRDALGSLTPREKDCLRHVLTTGSHKQIAHVLGLSTHTVDGYLKSAIRKLSVNSSVQAAQMLTAYEAGRHTPQFWGDQSSPLPPTDPGPVTIRPAGGTGPLSTSIPAGFVAMLRRWLRLPAGRISGGQNDLTTRQRFRESFQAMLFAIFAIGVLVTALSGLTMVAHALLITHH